jgi:hypothetical protein
VYVLPKPFLKQKVSEAQKPFQKQKVSGPAETVPETIR